MRNLPTDRVPIRFVWFDVDGTMTDGRLSYIELPRWYDSETIRSMVSFDSHDGHGLALLKAAGITFGFISGNTSEAVRARAEKLGASECLLDTKDKLAAVVERHNAPCSSAETAYMGDDLNDVEAMLVCGLALAPADAMPCAKAVAHYVTDKLAGRGAAREACEWILWWNERCKEPRAS